MRHCPSEREVLNEKAKNRPEHTYYVYMKDIQSHLKEESRYLS